MASSWCALAVDAHEPKVLGRWWAGVLDYQVVDEDETDISIAEGPEAELRIDFLAVPDAKTVKNRLHIDLRPDDRDAEVARLVEMGAKPVDVGQRDVSWVVLADPEGNEFCVLSSR